MKVYLLFCATIFAFAITPTSAIIHTVLMDYWDQIEKEFKPTDDQYNIFIFSEYSEDRRMVANSARSNETSLTVVIHESHWLRLKVACANSWEPKMIELNILTRHLHLVVDCESFQVASQPHTHYVRNALIVLVVLLVGLIVWKRDAIKTFITDRYQNSNFIPHEFAVYNNAYGASQDDVVNLA